MMFMHIRRNLIGISKNNASSKCHFRFSLSLLQSFSASVEKQTPSAIYDLIVHKHHLCPELGSRIASSFPRLKKMEKYDSVLCFLKESGFSNHQLEKMLNNNMSRFISPNLEGVIKPKIKLFQDSGFSANDIAEIISNDPDILRRSLNNRVMPSLLALKDLLGSVSKVAKVLKKSGYFLKYDVENTVVPNIEYLKSCGVAMERIKYLLHRSPGSLIRKPETMMRLVERVDEIGIGRSSRLFVDAIHTLGSMTEETWEKKCKAFENLGFSKNEIVAVFRKAPELFRTSEEKMKKFKEVVLASGKYDISCVVKYPMSLTLSIEKRYKPRLKVLGILESNNLIKDWPNFRDFYLMTDEDFFKKYVSPYLSKVGDLRELKSLFSGKRSDQQLGLQCNVRGQIL